MKLSMLHKMRMRASINGGATIWCHECKDYVWHANSSQDDWECVTCHNVRQWPNIQLTGIRTAMHG